MTKTNLVWDSLRRVLNHVTLPKNAQASFEKAKDEDDILVILNDLTSENELAIQKLTHEIEQFEAREQREMFRVRQHDISDREKKHALQAIQRIRREISSRDIRNDFHDKNIKLLQNLAHKIQLMKSMALQVVTDKQIDAIALTFQESAERFREVLEAGNASEALRHDLDDEKTARELAELEKEIHEQPEEEWKKKVREFEKEVLDEVKEEEAEEDDEEEFDEEDWENVEEEDEIEILE